MMNFFGGAGGGGGGGASCTAAGGGVMLLFSACWEVLSPVATAESSAVLRLVSESCRDLRDLGVLAGFVAAGGAGLSAGAGAEDATSAGGVVSAATPGFPTLLTSRLLITVLT